MTRCPYCAGSGKDGYYDDSPVCPRCSGAGEVEAPTDNVLNDLMARCVAARAKCVGASEDFQVIYDHDDETPWRVGFYEREQGKQVADDLTLEDALRSWLYDYEHRWD